jgi:hypothetical protein
MKDFRRSGFGPTYIKIGTIQRRLAWPLRKDDTQNREAFQTFALFENSFWRMSLKEQVLKEKLIQA